MNRKLGFFIGFIVLASVACAASVARLGWRVDASEVVAVACFAAFGLFAQIQSFRLPHSAAGSISFLPLLAGALVSPNWVIVAAAVASMMFAELHRRAALTKAVFNVAQLALAVGCSVLAYRALGGVGLLRAAPLNVAAYCALIAVYFGVNSFAVSGVVSLSQGQPFLGVWSVNTLRTGLYDLVALPVVYSLVQVYQLSGTGGLVLLAVIILGARQLYSTNLQLERANQDLLQVMVAAIEMRDPYTSGHSQRVAQYSRLIARAIGLSGKQIERVAAAALLHDVGKIDQRFAEILQKPGRLTDEERLIIEEHPVRSAELVAMVNGLQDLVGPVRHHHERWDGAGYPDGLAGEAIPLTARIIVFADTIDAMTSDRPYRPALGPAEVRRELLKHRGKQFDPYICDRLLESEQFDALFANLAQRAVTPLLSEPPAPTRKAATAVEPVAAA